MSIYSPEKLIFCRKIEEKIKKKCKKVLIIEKKLKKGLEIV